MADDSGFASVLGAFVICVLVVAMSGLVYLGSAVAARHSAQSAADLGALAGARDYLSDGVDRCVRARSVVERNGARMLGCRVDDVDVVVGVGVSVAMGVFGHRVARAVARAGPVI